MMNNVDGKVSEAGPSQTSNNSSEIELNHKACNTCILSYPFNAHTNDAADEEEEIHYLIPPHGSATTITGITYVNASMTESSESLAHERVEDSESRRSVESVSLPTLLPQSQGMANGRDLVKIRSSPSIIRVTGSGWVNICRICHGGMSLGDLVSPCRCRGSIALAHLECLEHWLKESAHSSCELCHHHYEIVCEPKYSIPTSILIFLRHPGDHAKELILDVLGFLIYTPSAAVTTYMLMLLYESIYKSELSFERATLAHFMAFITVFGIAAIDFTYSSWLMVCLQKHTEAWRNWYRNHSNLKVILPKYKMQRRRIDDHE